MPSTARASGGGVCYHVINRGNARQDVFHKDDDFAAFLKLLQEASERLPMRLLAYCVLNNPLDRGTPFGSEKWQKRISKRLGLESTLRPRGRPRKRKPS